MTAIELALRRGCDYLLASQDGDGAWRDFHLPVGVSDAWTTAFVGYALAEAATRLKWPGALDGAAPAADWLLTDRPYRRGWGYNASTGADADSTAYALLLLEAAWREVPDADRAWLAGRFGEEGGCATYDGPGAWADAHADVTPLAYLALDRQRQAELRPRVRDYLRRTRREDGHWPAYWWGTLHYSTYHNRLLTSRLGLNLGDGLPRIGGHPARRVESAFDLAWVMAGAALAAVNGSTMRGLVAELLGLQRADGAWPGAANLRVTDPSCGQPWHEPRGALYADDRGLLTTASAVRALARLV